MWTYRQQVALVMDYGGFITARGEFSLMSERSGLSRPGILL